MPADQSTAMRYRRFGKTELQMPVITCGGMRFQHKWEDIPMGDVPLDGQANLEAAIRKALDMGINHIETARGYGSSEMQLGQILPNLPRDQMLIQTKVPPSADPKEFVEKFEESMKYLKLDYVDLFSMHGVNNEEVLDYALRKGGCMEIARRWQTEGRIRHIGFSTHGSCDMICKAIESDEFEYVNLHWYFVNDLNWPAVMAAHERDMGVFIISPNDKGGKLYEPSEKLVELCQPLRPMEFNDLYCWNREEVHTLSMGVSCPEDFDTHLDALERIDETRELIAPIEKRLRYEVDSICGESWGIHWSDGIPEWEAFEGGMNVKEIVRLWMWAKALDMTAFGKMRYNLLGNGNHWFPGNKVQKFDESRLLETVSENPFAQRIPDILREADAMLKDEEVKRLSES